MRDIDPFSSIGKPVRDVEPFSMFERLFRKFKEIETWRVCIFLKWKNSLKLAEEEVDTLVQKPTTNVHVAGDRLRIHHERFEEL